MRDLNSRITQACKLGITSRPLHKESVMILVTRLNKASQFYVNEDLIEFIEETPDTIVTLNTGKKITVSESAIDVVEKIREEKIRIRRATAF